MRITEIRVKLSDDPGSKLRGYCSVTFDNAFVVRDLKIIDGAKGPFVAMPSRKLADRCSRCGGKNHLRAAYCNGCGRRLDVERANRDGDRPRLHADLAHPINSDCRITLHKAVVQAFHEEIERSKLDGYQPQSFDDLDDLGDAADDDYVSELLRRSEARERARRDDADQGGSGAAAAQ